VEAVVLQTTGQKQIDPTLGDGLQIFDKLALYNKVEPTDAENQAEIKRIKTLKAKEEASSQVRMKEMQAIEEARLKQVAKKQKTDQSNEKRIMFFALLIIILFIGSVLLYTAYLGFLSR